MAILTDRALILRRTPFGESSLVVQVLTERHGRVHLMAKGAYRHTSRYFCVLDLFHELELEWSHQKNRELQTLRKADLTVRRRSLTSDVIRYRAAVEVLELMELSARPGQADPTGFALLSRALELLGRPEVAPEAVRSVFGLKFLANLGLAPSLRDCAACGGPAPVVQGTAGTDSGRVAFSAGAGGRLCLDCAREARASGRRVGTLSERLVENAGRIARSGVREAQSLPDSELEETRRFTERFMDYHLEIRPKSRRSPARGSRGFRRPAPPLEARR